VTSEDQNVTSLHTNSVPGTLAHSEIGAAHETNIVVDSIVRVRRRWLGGTSKGEKEDKK
jgi:hypothetical protein